MQLRFTQGRIRRIVRSDVVRRQFLSVRGHDQSRLMIRAVSMHDPLRHARHRNSHQQHQHDPAHARRVPLLLVADSA